MLKVVVIEDEELVRKGIVLTMDWASMNCMVVGEAENGEEGIEAVKQYNPHIIITDVAMPRMDGIQMLTKLREMGNRAYVIILTAYSDFAYAQSAIRLGAVDYLLKPFHDGDMERAIEKVRDRIEQTVQPDDAPAVTERFDLIKGDKSKYVMEALDYIAAHYKDPNIGVAAISSHVGISEGHLIHVFKKETAYTITGYLTQYRIHIAMELLKDCKLKVYEVASQVGYRDVAYFSSTFKKAVGFSPSEYQDRCTR